MKDEEIDMSSLNDTNFIDNCYNGMKSQFFGNHNEIGVFSCYQEEAIVNNDNKEELSDIISTNNDNNEQLSDIISTNNDNNEQLFDILSTNTNINIDSFITLTQSYDTEIEEDDLNGKPTETQTKTCESDLSKKGRRKKSNNSISTIGLSTGHTKKDKDNIRRKIKVKFTQFIIKFFNLLIKLKYNGRQIKIFRTFDYIITKNITIRTNRKMSTTLLKIFLCNPVSYKYKKCDRNQNKYTLNFIQEKNDEKINYFLNMTIEDFYNKVFLGDGKKFMQDNEVIIQKFKKKTCNPLFFSDVCESEKDKSYADEMEKVGLVLFDFFNKTTYRLKRE